MFLVKIGGVSHLKPRENGQTTTSCLLSLVDLDANHQKADVSGTNGTLSRCQNELQFRQ